MDSFALPVEGTETRVNAQEQAYEYMTAYMETANQVISQHVWCFKALSVFALVLSQKPIT